MNQLDFQGRHAVVTGGAAGLGFAIAQRLLASGGTVSLWDRDIAQGRQAAEKLGTGSTFVQVDVTDETSVREARGVHGAPRPRIDALVNSAGITGPNTKVWEYPVDAWQRVIEVNLNGLFLCCREVVPIMRAANYGRIVNIASVAGKDGNPNASAYSASKAAVIALTKSLGKELADTGIRVNCVTPAAVKTAIFDQMSEQHIQFMLSKIPMGRFGTPEEIAAMVAWLCTEDAPSPPARCSTCRAAAPPTDPNQPRRRNNETRALWQPRQGKARPDRSRRQAARPEQRGAGHRPRATGAAWAMARIRKANRPSCRWCAASRASAARWRRCGKFIAIGLNYADHAAESGMPIPAEPVVFMKATSCIQGPNDPVMLPRGSVKADWEVELGIVIGTRATCRRRTRWRTWRATPSSTT